MATIVDVAERAGVSIATVSRIMNNRGPISDKTRKKVYKAMKELDYKPNEIARALQKKKSQIIGLIVPVIDYAFFSRLTDAIEETCQQNGYKLMLCKSGADEAMEKEMVSMLQGNKVDGILLCSRLGDASIYTEFSLPIISIDREIEKIPSVTSDNYNGGMMAAKVLIDAGCKNILLFGGDVPEYMPMHLRNNGFYDECKKNGVEYIEYTLNSEEDLREEVPADFVDLLKKNPQIDGVFVNGDLIAARLFHVLEKAGIDVLKDLPAVGFDGMEISEIINLTTIEQPIWEIGECAVDLLLKKIEGKMVPERSILPVKLIERKSTLFKTNKQ
ncbi:MAG: LacI family DNA-binding transcriptional regulator [Eubacteriales bacterium]